MASLQPAKDDETVYDPTTYKPTSPEYHPRSDDEAEEDPEPSASILQIPKKKRYFYKDGSLKVFIHWPPGSKGDLEKHYEENPELYKPLVYSSEYDYSEDESQEDKPITVYQWAQRYPHGIPSWCFKDFDTKPPVSTWDPAEFEEVDITVEHNQYREQLTKQIRTGQMYPPQVAIPVKEENSVPSPSQFETDFFFPVAAAAPTHRIPDADIKRKRESDEETEEYPDSSDTRPLGVNPYETTWECLGRPNPKVCRTQYLIYEHSSAERAHGEFHAQVMNESLDPYVRRASHVMSIRYSILVSHYRDELTFREKQGEKIPIAELFDESADV
jgi:hypothetical protein